MDNEDFKTICCNCWAKNHKAQCKQVCHNQMDAIKNDQKRTDQTKWY